MSAIEAGAYPRPCQNQTCRQPLYGAVYFCPFCGSKQMVTAPIKVIPALEVPVAAAPSAVAPPAPSTIAQTTTTGTGALHDSPPAKPRPPAPRVVKTVPATDDEKTIFLSPAIWGIALILVLAGAFFYRMTFHNSKIEATAKQESLSAERKLKLVEEGYDCLHQKDYVCAIARAEIMLDIEPRNPQAKKLLREAKNARESQPKDTTNAEIEFKVLLDNIDAAAKECIAQHDAPCARRNIEELASKAPSDPRLPNLNYLAAKDCAEQHDTACMRVNIDELRDRAPKEKHLADLDKQLIRLEFERTRGPLDNPPAEDKSAQSTSSMDAAEKPATKLMAVAQGQLAKGDYDAAIATANAAKLLEPDNQLIDVFIDQAKQARDGKPK